MSPELEEAFARKEEFARQKEQRIEALKSTRIPGLPLFQEFEVNQRLYLEYRKFQIDSAARYILRNLEISSGDRERYHRTQLQLADLYSSAGKYRESEIILGELKGLSGAPLTDYYDIYTQLFEHYLTNTLDSSYSRQVAHYRDSLLAVLDTATTRYKIQFAQKKINENQPDIAGSVLASLFNSTREKNSDYAMICYLLGEVYRIKGRPELQQQYYSLSASADIVNAIRDNAAVQSLASWYFEDGDIENAYVCTKSAVEDALFCKVKFRALQLSQLYAIVNGAYQQKEARDKRELRTYLIALVALAAVLVFAVVYVLRQMRKISRVKESLYKTSQQLAKLNGEISVANDQLRLSNDRLAEANHVKEEYIANFFDICSSYINKIENFRSNLFRKATARQYDELTQTLRSTSVVDTELHELYRNFDTIFLNLYPGFVRDFNALLLPEEQIVLKHGELLNTELRIFALVRLGITDSVRIAAFLRYSLSTIYNYRTKARNKAAVSRDEFEHLVMQIGSIARKMP